MSGITTHTRNKSRSKRLAGVDSRNLLRLNMRP